MQAVGVPSERGATALSEADMADFFSSPDYFDGAQVTAANCSPSAEFLRDAAECVAPGKDKAISSATGNVALRAPDPATNTVRCLSGGITLYTRWSVHQFISSASCWALEQRL